MATNDFLPFGLAIGSNVMPQASYATMAQRTSGFTSGVAQSSQLNKVWRQSAFIAAMVAQFTADRSGKDVLDDGNIATAEASLVAAIAQVAGTVVTGGNFATVPALNAVNSTLTSALSAESTSRAAQDSTEATARNAGDVAEANTRFIQDNNIQTASIARDTAITNSLANYALLSGFNNLSQMPGFQKLPSGLIFQWLTAKAASGISFTLLPLTFPNFSLGLVSSYGSAIPPSTGTVGVDFFDNSTVRIYNSAPAGPHGCYILGWGY